IKFMVLGIGSIFVVQIYLASQTLLFSSVHLALEPVGPYTLLVSDALIALGLVRNRLVETDITLSPGFLQNSFTFVVVSVYLIAVGILAVAILFLGGNEVLPLAILFVFAAVIGLSVLLLSDQVRHRARRFVMRNFTAPRYDYRRAWSEFTARTTSLVEARDLCASLATMVSETFGVPSVSIWLVDDSSEECRLGGSTVLSDFHLQAKPHFEVGAAVLARTVRDRSEPLDLAAAEDAASVALRRDHADFLAAGPVSTVAPLVDRGQLVGILTLSERVTREAFTAEDRDLLQTISNQAAAGILNRRLAERLVEAKELEAFQTLSAFFTHDLKNLASTLSLTMQNLPANFDNPEFRRDAFRVIGESVKKIDALCARLSLLRKELEIDRRERDLNEIVRVTTSAMNGSLKVPVVPELGPPLSIRVDAEQIEKVLTNLLLNANEAIGEHGEIRVSIARRDGWAIVTVADDGCGMSREFVAGSLFRPFQTTKSQGLGIGLFQSKRIVEAHEGRIEVDSELGRGSRFHVVLPAR
ncbi:MAG: hypothetical protein QOD06_522, partial [Candidatus Binatota bacterium]|nr:hypothetical protein [Candidatus Binatota bacterium]